MTVEDIKYEIARIEREIGYCDDTIKSVSEKIKEYQKQANQCLELAAKGGGIGHTPEERRKAAEECQYKANSIRWKIDDAESKKKLLISELDYYKSELEATSRESTPRENTQRRAPESVNYTAHNEARRKSPRKSKVTTVNDYLRKAHRQYIKDAFKIVIPYEAALVAILYVSDLLYMGRLTGLVLMVFGPIVFAVVVKKMYLNKHIPPQYHKKLYYFLSYLLGFALTLVAMFEISKATIIWMVVVCVISAYSLERMIWDW